MTFTDIFSRDVHQIHIAGSKRIALDLVNLSGFTHDGRGEVAVALAVEYMRNPRSIILAVVSASADPDTQ